MAKEIHKRINLWLNQQGIENNLKSVRQAINKTANELAKLPIGTEEWYRKSEKLQKLKDIQAELQKEIKATSAEIEKQNRSLNTTIVNAGSIASVYQTASAAVQRFVSATQEYVDAYAKVDSAMQSVVKSSGLARDEVEELRESFSGFDTRTSTGELLKIAEVGGHLGLTKDQLRDFVQYTDQAMQTIGMSAEEVANAFSKIQRTFSDVSGQDISTTIQQAGSAMNALDKVTTSTEANIMAFTEAVGKMSDGIKPSLADTLALGAAFESAGLDAQQAATGYARILTTARADIGKFTSVMGQTEEQLRNLINTKPAEFLLEFAESLKGLPTAEQGEKLKELGLNSQRLDSTIGALTKNTQEFRTALQLSAEEYGKASAMTENYNALNSTAAAQLEKAKKAVDDAKAALGEELLPVITELTQASAGGIKVVTEVIKWGTQHQGAVLSLAAAYTVLLAVKNKKLIADKAEAVQTKISNPLRQMAIITAVKKKVALAQETAATEAKRLAEMKARLETLKGVAADNQLRAVLQQETVAKTANAAATRAQEQAQRLLNTATKSTPWGLIAAGITAAVVGITHLVEKSREATKATEELNKKISEESSYAEYLVNVLKNTQEGSDEYKKALEKLRELYPDIIQAHIDEHGQLTNLDAAYRDIVTSIENKIAAQLKEEAITEALNKKLTKTRNILAKINKEMTAQGISANKRQEVDDIIQSEIPKLLKEGKSAEEAANIVMESIRNLGVDVSRVYRGFIAGGRNIFLLTKVIAEASEEANKAISSANELYDPLIHEPSPQKSSPQKPEANVVTHNADDPEHCMCADCVKQRKKNAEDRAKEETKKWKDFQKRVSSLRAKAAEESMSGWEQVKAQTAAKYDELIEQAKTFGAKGISLAKQLEGERAAAIAAAGQQYLQKQGKTLEDFSRKIQDWVKETAPEEGNEILNAVLGTEQKWAQRFSDAQAQMQTLMELRAQFVADNQDTAALDQLIDKLEADMNRMADAEAADVQKTLQKYQTGIDDFIKSEQKSVTDATLSETERQKNAIREKYELEIQLIEKLKAARKAEEGADADVSDLEAKIKELKELLDKQLATVDKAAASSGSKNVWQQLAEFDWSKIRDNWQSALGLMAQGLQDFANAATDIYQKIADAQQQSAELELQRFTEAQDAKGRKLKQQLDDGLISQKYYDAKMEEMAEEKERKEKKMKHDQFEKEKTASVVQSVIQGALSVATTLAQWGLPGGLIPAALATAMTVAQTALIASQPNPYYRGGFIRGRQYAVMGERGDEWVASNPLLEDPETAPLINALEAYQRGNRHDLALLLQPSEPDWKKVSQTASDISSTFAADRTPVVQHHYQTAGSDELLKEVRRMNQFLSDPKNRQAYISYKIQTEADTNREFIKNAARL